MTNKARPLSPHLQVYRWEITMFMSIMHRATGIALSVGALVLTLWLLSILKAGNSFLLFYTFAKSPAGVLVSYGWMFSLVFHFLSGIRHLVLDTGRGLSKPSAKLTAWIVLLGSFVITTGLWNYAAGLYSTPAQ